MCSVQYLFTQHWVVFNTAFFRVCVYIYIYIYIYACMHVWVCNNIDNNKQYICVCVCVCVCNNMDNNNIFCML